MPVKPRVRPREHARSLALVYEIEAHEQPEQLQADDRPTPPLVNVPNRYLVR